MFYAARAIALSPFVRTLEEWLGLVVFNVLAGLNINGIDFLFLGLYPFTTPESFGKDRRIMYDVATAYAKKDYPSLNHPELSSASGTAEVVETFLNRTMNMENLCALLDGRSVSVTSGIYDALVNWREGGYLHETIVSVCGAATPAGSCLKVSLVRRAMAMLTALPLTRSSLVTKLCWTIQRRGQIRRIHGILAEQGAQFIAFMNQTQYTCPGHKWSVPCACAHRQRMSHAKACRKIYIFSTCYSRARAPSRRDVGADGDRESTRASALAKVRSRWTPA